MRGALLWLLSFLSVFSAMSLTTWAAIDEPQIFTLPDARVGEAYHVKIEAILRDRYRLRLQGNTSDSNFQWVLADGALPPGVIIQADGTLLGSPLESRHETYRFRVRVSDSSAPDELLILECALSVNTPGLRLVKINAPILVPFDRSQDEPGRTLSGLPAREDATNPVVKEGGTELSPYLARHPVYSLPKYEATALATFTPGAAITNYTAPDQSIVSDLLRRSRGEEVIVTIDTPAKSVPKPVEVKNGSAVTVRGSKRPVDVCVVATKREELKPEPNPLAQFLKVIVGFGAFGVADVANANSLCPGDPDPSEVPNDAEARQIESEIRSIRSSLFQSIQIMQQAHTEYEGKAKRVKNFVSCKDVDGVTDICTPANFDGAKDALKADLIVLLNKKLPVVDSADLQLTTLKKVLADRYKKPAGQLDELWLQKVNARLDCFSQNMEALKKDREVLTAARNDLEKFQDLIEGHQTKFEYSQLLLVDANSKVTGTVACTNFFTKQVTVEPIPFSVTYQNLPRATVSAGILFSLLDRRQIGIQPVRTGTAADGTPTFRLTFAESDRSNSQVVPFSFFNYYLTGTRKLNLNLSAGVGLNPNNGSNQVEYFIGGALGMKNVYLQFGGHVGRWQELGQGFVIGDAVPDKFPATAPIERRYSIKPAVGVSYRLPLP